MSDPIATVVLVADSPQQASLLVERLRAEGIAAALDADSQNDELVPAGTGVLVPSASLDRARDVLAAVEIDEELDAQARAAAQPEREEPPRPVPTPRRRWPFVAACAAAATFLALWLSEVDARARERHPFLRYERTERGMREIRTADDKLLAEWIDADRDGAYEKMVAYGEHGQKIVSIDRDRDGRWDHAEQRRRGGLVGEWSDTDGDRMPDTCIVRNENGKELQRLVWVDGTGFQLQPR